MTTDETVTYLEMTDRGQLRPGRPAPDVTLEPLPAGSPAIRSTIVRIGTPYRWSSATWSDAHWDEVLRDSSRRQFAVLRGGQVAGIAEVGVHPDDEVEILSFGLVPEYVGAGFGGHALTLAIRAAWDLDHPDVGTVRRVWLHTSTLDHPNALPNYRRRGLVSFRTEVRRHA